MRGEEKRKREVKKPGSERRSREVKKKEKERQVATGVERVQLFV